MPLRLKKPIAYSQPSTALFAQRGSQRRQSLFEKRSYFFSKHGAFKKRSGFGSIFQIRLIDSEAPARANNGIFSSMDLTCDTRQQTDTTDDESLLISHPI
jgi:hypothetical protein